MNFRSTIAFAFIAVAAQSSPAHSQSSFGRAQLWPGYPGSILISPQQANFKAPAIYRTVEDQDNIQNPVAVRQLCIRDIQLLRQRKIISEGEPIAAAGVQNASSRLIGGKISADVASVASLEASAKYDQVVTLNTGEVQVYDTDDDNIAATLLKNVSPACRAVIAGHLSKRRWVFVAATAIQAYNYEAKFERVASATASAKCSWGWFCSAAKVEAEVTGTIKHEDRAYAEKKFVTLALVPAEIGDHQFITTADLGSFTTAASTSGVYSNARLARTTAVRVTTRYVRNAAYRHLASR
jgi:hypothetical protein